MAMAQRVVFALRELAEALEVLQLESPGLFEREQGEATRAAPGGPVPSPASATSASSGPTASSVAYHSDLRLYLVLVWPGDETKAGRYVCTGRQLEVLLPGQALAGAAAKLKRVTSRSQAEELWSREFPGRALREHRL